MNWRGRESRSKFQKVVNERFQSSIDRRLSRGGRVCQNVFRYCDNFQEEFAICSTLQLEWNGHDAVWRLSNFETNPSLSSHENDYSSNAYLVPECQCRNEYTDPYKHSWPIHNSREILATKWAMSRQKQIPRITNRSQRLCNNLHFNNNSEPPRERERENRNTVRRNRRDPNQRSKLPLVEKIELTVTIDSNTQSDFFN